MLLLLSLISIIIALHTVACRDRIEAIAQIYADKNYSAITGARNDDFTVMYLGYVKFVQEANSDIVKSVLINK
jgi:hypothetical protein